MLKTSQLYQSLLKFSTLARSEIGLQHKLAYTFARGKKYSKDGKMVHVTAEDLFKQEEWEQERARKRKERKGITGEDPVRKIGEEILRKAYEEPESLENDIIEDPNSGFIGRKEYFEGREETEEYKAALEYYKEDIEKIAKQEAKNEARRKRREARRKGEIPEDPLLDKEEPQSEIENQTEKTQGRKKKGYLRDLTYEEKKKSELAEKEEASKKADKKEEEKEEEEFRPEEEVRNNKPKQEAKERKEKPVQQVKSEPRREESVHSKEVPPRESKRNEEQLRAIATEDDTPFDAVLEEFASFESPIDEMVAEAAEESSEKEEKSTDKKKKLVQEISEEKIKSIEKRLEKEANLPEEATQIEVSHKAKKEPAIKDYNTFVNKLTKKKTPSKFYNFLRTVKEENLVKLMGQHALIEKNPAQNIPKFLVLMSYMRKMKVLQNYNREDIYNVFNTIIKNLDILTPIEISSVVVNLDRMKIDKVEYFKELEKKIIEDAPKYDLRTIANIAFSFARISMKQSITDNFSELYRKLETIISLKLNKKNPQDICQIMVGYSKAQAFSPEFLYVMEQTALELFDRMNTQEIAVIAHCFVKNEYDSEGYFNKIRERLLESPEAFKAVEIAILAEAFYQLKKLDKELFRAFEKQFSIKSEHVNAQDIASFCKVLFSEEYSISEETKSKITSVCDILYHNIDANCLRKMFENFGERYKQKKYNEEYVNFCLRKYKNLEKKEEIRGANLSYIRNEINKAKTDEMFKKKLMKMFSK